MLALFGRNCGAIMSVMNLSLAQVASALSLSLDSTVLVNQVVIDSRLVMAGDVFVALVGERVDGHDFVVLAEQKGAVAAVVSRLVDGVNIPQLVVDDPVLALQMLSAFWRNQYRLSHCVLVTGSNGKTSVKEMLSACFSAKFGQDHVCATQGNLNNHLGLPLSLLSLRPEHQVGVFEVGANHLGEIAQLSPLAQPSSVMITSIGMAHVGEFGGIEAIKQAKAEIFSALPDGGLAVVPVLAQDGSSDALFDGWSLWQSRLERLFPVVFGELQAVERSRGWQKWLGLVGTRIEVSAGQLWQRVRIASSDWGSAELNLPILGRHQAMNAIAVSAVLLAQEFSWQEIQQGLERLILPKGRLKPIQLTEHCLIIDDSYNANPSSMMAAVQVLADVSVDQRVLVLGDMAELGESAEDGHFMVGLYAREYAINQVYALGNYASAYQEGFGRAIPSFDTHDALAEALWKTIQALAGKQERIAILVKGSRSSQMEKVIECLQGYLTIHLNNDLR